MLTARRALALAAELAGITLAGIAVAGIAVAGTAPAAVAATGRQSYSAPSWSQFESDLSSAEGLASGQGVTVAVLSTGVDTSAAGLAGKVTEGPDYAFAPRGSLVNSLGTEEAGLIVGVPGVVSGIAPDARILGIRVEPDSSESGAKAFSNANYGDNSANTGQVILARAITYAVAHGASVIEVDPEVWNWDGLSQRLAAAVKDAVRRNVVIVAPGWKYGGAHGDYQYPAGLPGVIGVGSVLLPGGIAPAWIGASGSGNESADNNSVVISGPGDWIRSTPAFWGLYDTTAAAPYVAGAVALIKQLHPGMPPAMVEQALAMSARNKPKGGYSQSVGFGVLDPYAAVLDADRLAKDTMTAAPGPGTVAAGARFAAGPRPGVIDALPPAGGAVYGYWAAIGGGALLLVLAVVLAAAGTVRSRRRRAA